MLIELDGPRIVVTSPAKLNLFLEITGMLPDGFHAIETLMCPISLCDKLIFEENNSTNIRLRVVLPSNRCAAYDSAWEIPNDRSNLVVRAVERVRQELGLSAGCELTLFKNIPATAGLGGGSSDAASAIVASLVGWSEWDKVLAGDIAASLGSDINFFLGDANNGVGMARCIGRGEQVDGLPFQTPLFFAVCHPPIGCSTKEVYQRCRIPARPRTCEAMVNAVQSASIEGVGNELFNALLEPATQINDWIPRQMEYFKRMGARNSSMTGSGSACFTLASSVQEAEELVRQMQLLGLSHAWAAESWYAPPIQRQVNGIVAAKPISA